MDVGMIALRSSRLCYNGWLTAVSKTARFKTIVNFRLILRQKYSVRNMYNNET